MSFYLRSQCIFGAGICPVCIPGALRSALPAHDNDYWAHHDNDYHDDHNHDYDYWAHHDYHDNDYRAYHNDHNDGLYTCAFITIYVF